MKRKEFIKTACGLGLAGGAATLKGKASVRQEAPPAKAEKLPDRFKEAWIGELMQNMEQIVDPETRGRLMNACGRACARRSGILKSAEKYKGDIHGFVAAFGPRVGKTLCRVEGDVVHWGYPRCYCELVEAGPDRLPDSYCLCSAGWVQEVFETAAGRPVRVEVVQTIKRGAPDCRFLVRL